MNNFIIDGSLFFDSIEAIKECSNNVHKELRISELENFDSKFTYKNNVNSIVEKLELLTDGVTKLHSLIFTALSNCQKLSSDFALSYYAKASSKFSNCSTEQLTESDLRYTKYNSKAFYETLLSYYEDLEMSGSLSDEQREEYEQLKNEKNKITDKIDEHLNKYNIVNATRSFYNKEFASEEYYDELIEIYNYWITESESRSAQLKEANSYYYKFKKAIGEDLDFSTEEILLAREVLYEFLNTDINDSIKVDIMNDMSKLLGGLDILVLIDKTENIPWLLEKFLNNEVDEYIASTKELSDVKYLQQELGIIKSLKEYSKDLENCHMDYNEFCRYNKKALEMLIALYDSNYPNSIEKPEFYKMDTMSFKEKECYDILVKKVNQIEISEALYELNIKGADDRATRDKVIKTFEKAMKYDPESINQSGKEMLNYFKNRNIYEDCDNDVKNYFINLTHPDPDEAFSAKKKMKEAEDKQYKYADLIANYEQKNGIDSSFSSWDKYRIFAKHDVAEAFENGGKSIVQGVEAIGDGEILEGIGDIAKGVYIPTATVVDLGATTVSGVVEYGVDAVAAETYDLFVSPFANEDLEKDWYDFVNKDLINGQISIPGSNLSDISKEGAGDFSYDTVASVHNTINAMEEGAVQLVENVVIDGVGGLINPTWSYSDITQEYMDSKMLVQLANDNAFVPFQQGSYFYEGTKSITKTAGTVVITVINPYAGAAVAGLDKAGQVSQKDIRAYVNTNVEVYIDEEGNEFVIDEDGNCQSVEKWLEDNFDLVEGIKIRADMVLEGTAEGVVWYYTFGNQGLQKTVLKQDGEINQFGTWLFDENYIKGTVTPTFTTKGKVLLQGTKTSVQSITNETFISKSSEEGRFGSEWFFDTAFNTVNAMASTYFYEEVFGSKQVGTMAKKWFPVKTDKTVGFSEPVNFGAVTTQNKSALTLGPDVLQSAVKKVGGTIIKNEYKNIGDGDILQVGEDFGFYELN